MYFVPGWTISSDAVCGADECPPPLYEPGPETVLTFFGYSNAEHDFCDSLTFDHVHESEIKIQGRVNKHWLQAIQNAERTHVWMRWVMTV